MAAVALGLGADFNLTECRHALDQHQCAHRSKEEHVAHRYENVELARLAQHAHELDAQNGADQPAKEQNETHFEIDIVAAILSNGARDRGGHNLGRAGAHGHGGGDAGQHQQGGDEEAAANAEHAGQKAHCRAHADINEDVRGGFGNRKIEVHCATASCASLTARSVNPCTNFRTAPAGAKLKRPEPSSRHSSLGHIKRLGHNPGSRTTRRIVAVCKRPLTALSHFYLAAPTKSRGAPPLFDVRQGRPPPDAFHEPQPTDRNAGRLGFALLRFCLPILSRNGEHSCRKLLSSGIPSPT